MGGAVLRGRGLRRAGFALVLLAAVAGAVLIVRDGEAPREASRFAADHILFVREDWLRSPAAKAGAAAVRSACDFSSGVGDLDADGALDAVITYSTERDCAANRPAYRAAVIRSDGVVLQAPIDGDVDTKSGHICPLGCRVFSVADLNDDGWAEVVLELSHGASQTQLGIYRLGPNGLVRLRTVAARGLEPTRFSYYGSVCCGSHVACRGRDLVVASSYGRTMLGGTAYVGEWVYRFDGRRFIEVDNRSYPPRALGDRRGTTVPGRACIEPRPERNAERDLDQILRGA